MNTPRSLFLRHLAQTSDAPLALEVETAHGVWLTGPDGRKTMDLISGIGMSPLGHTHPAVVSAVRTQAERYMHVMVYGEYVLSPQVQLATRLAATLPAGLDSVYLHNSGTEAVEGAMKLAKRYTGRAEIISARRAYHGSTQGAMSLMSEPDFTEAFLPLLPGIRHIRYNDVEDLEMITRQTAGVVVETVQGESGIRLPDVGWMQALRARCDETGALLILDEIQCGYGRTGRMWAFEHVGIQPDVLITGKGMGGGMPMAAFIARAEVMQVLSRDPVLGHITTFGGHPVSAAAALATLDTLLTSGLIGTVYDRSSGFRDRLERHPAIREVRNLGWMMALDVGDASLVQRTIRHALELGIVCDWFLFNATSIRIAPPLIISEDEAAWAADRLIKALDRALAES